MREFIIRYNGVPEEVRGAIDPLFKEHMWILPSWVETMNVDFISHSTSATALEVRCCEEYRTLYLNIMPNWLIQDADVRSIDVKHEFLHVNINSLHVFGLQVIEATLDKTGALHTWAQEQLRLAVERAACDLENMLGRIPK
jgi:hypothetical protein